MAELETVQIKKGKGSVVINAQDFNPDTDELYTAKAESVEAEEEVKPVTIFAGKDKAKAK